MNNPGIARVLALTVAALATTWALYLSRDALLVIYVSVLLAIGFAPVVHAIEGWTFLAVTARGLPRWSAILVVYVAIVGMLILVGILVIPPLADQAQELWARLPSFVDRAESSLIRYGLLADRITLQQAIRIAPGPGDTFGTLATALTRTAGGVFGIVTVLILTFYLLVESESLFSAFARMFPRADRPRVVEVAGKISTKISAWLSGQLMLAATIGTTAAIGLWLLGIPYFYVLAVVAGLGELIPVLGPILAAVPAVLVGLSVSPQKALFVLVFFVVQQQVENHLLVPRVMARQVGISPVTVITALLIGGSLLGVLGAILAVPTAAIVQVVVQELLDERDRRQDRLDMRM